MQRKSISNLLGGGSVANKQQDLQNLSKINKPTTSKPSRGKNMLNTLESIKFNVNKYLGKYKDKVEACRDINAYISYIDKAIEFGYISIDTETDGLDPLINNVLGVCLYVPGQKAIYAPTNHRSYITGNLLNNQIPKDVITEQFNRIKDAGVKIIMHNGKFDKRMILSNYKVDLTVYWDTMIAAKLLNNLDKAALKWQYAKYIRNESQEYDFDSLFKEIEFAYVPVDIAGLYGATDPLITWDLYEYQIKEFKKYPRVYDLFKNLEMPLIDVVCEMENTGICLDLNYAQELHEKYHKLKKECMQVVTKELEKYKPQIDLYMLKNPKGKFTIPVNVDSPTQLAILLYDIIQVGVLDKDSPRGTGVEILEKWGTPLAKAILEYRTVTKLLTTYIDKLPYSLNPNTNRLHASFIQVKDDKNGTDTGRFASADPNLQNIPSHNKEIRKLFVASPGYALIGSDYSQQEPKLLTHFSQDENMAKAYADGKDLYATIAAQAFDRKYEDCLEFYPEGTVIKEKGKEVVCGYKTHTNKVGKEYRSQAKSILLGRPRGYNAPLYSNI